MSEWYQIIPKYPWLSIYVWIIFIIFPFFFIFRSNSLLEITIGLALTLLFVLAYRLSFFSEGKLFYFCLIAEIGISVIMTYLFAYIYFAIFLAFFIGNIKSKTGFFIIYSVHLLATILAIILGFISDTAHFLIHLPYIILCLLGIILLPFHTYNRHKQGMLEDQLEDAHNRISNYMIIEERERIARDLHDTLGQKLSLIGLKSDLASRLIEKDPLVAKNEILEINHTARAALKEVRELISGMRVNKLEEEIARVSQILEAAKIDCKVVPYHFNEKVPPLLENVLSMCLKEAVTNVVKHSQATVCIISLAQNAQETTLTVTDNGIGIEKNKAWSSGHGLLGIKERLDFINGNLEINSAKGTTAVSIHVPNVIQQTRMEV